jgi:hypothetical protein
MSVQMQNVQQTWQRESCSRTSNQNILLKKLDNVSTLASEKVFVCLFVCLFVGNGVRLNRIPSIT